MTSSEETAFDEERARQLGERAGLVVESSPEGRGRRVAIAAARFNGGITLRLLEGALEALAEAGVERGDVTLAWVPGAFELPVAARTLIDSTRRPDAVVALGAVVRGETGHYDFVAGECASGLARVALDTGVPVIFGVLTTDTVKQALSRSTPGSQNKGREAALTALEMASLQRSLPPRP
jgi:6,7-dimethyl-8-ribityllumazine synthase